MSLKLIPYFYKASDENQFDSIQNLNSRARKGLGKAKETGFK